VFSRKYNHSPPKKQRHRPSRAFPRTFTGFPAFPDLSAYLFGLPGLFGPRPATHFHPNGPLWHFSWKCVTPSVTPPVAAPAPQSVSRPCCLAARPFFSMTGHPRRPELCRSGPVGELKSPAKTEKAGIRSWRVPHGLFSPFYLRALLSNLEPASCGLRACIFASPVQVRALPPSLAWPSTTPPSDTLWVI